MKLLRRLFSILLLAFFGLPIVSPLLALSATGGMRVPACCRREGKHHCSMSVAERNRSEPQSSEARFQTPAESCPYSPAAVVAIHRNLLAIPAGGGVFALLVIHPSGVVQTVSMWRMTRDRSRQKRGPPVQI